MINLAEFTDAEIAAIREFQRRITDRDRDKRRRAMREYRVFLDYLLRHGRITPEKKTELEYYRIEKRHR